MREYKKINEPDCEFWRRSLTVDFKQNGKKVVVVCLNPSRANGEVSDRTVSILEKYFAGKKYKKMTLYNLFQFYSLEPNKIKLESKTNFSDGDIQENLAEADEIVLAWGVDVERKYKEIVEEFFDNISRFNNKLFCFKNPDDEICKLRHPSRKRNDAILVKYSRDK